MASMERLKLYLESALPNVTLGDIGYYQKRKKVWLQSQFDLQTVVKEQLSKGKGALWCSMAKPAVVEQHSEACDSEEVPDIPPTSSAKRKKSLVEEKRERVQGIFEDLKGLHQTKYTAPQYRLWAEAIDIGQHVSRETPPLGTMFQRCGATPVWSSKNELSEAFTELAKSVSSAIGGKRTPPNQSPPKEHRSITPAKAAALKTTYINQIKDLHDLFESGAICGLPKATRHCLDANGEPLAYTCNHACSELLLFQLKCYNVLLFVNVYCVL